MTLPLMDLALGKAVDMVNTSAKKAVSAHVFDYINIYLMQHDIRGIRQFSSSSVAWMISSCRS